MKSIAFYNNKGGVGKTTSAINIAYELAKNSKVLIIDVDGQANCSRFFTEETNRFSARTMTTIPCVLWKSLTRRKRPLKSPISSPNAPSSTPPKLPTLILRRRLCRFPLIQEVKWIFRIWRSYADKSRRR